MNKYKVQFIHTETFVIDVLASTEAEAINLATADLKHNGYGAHQVVGDPTDTVEQVFDVTNTDDPFNPEN